MRVQRHYAKTPIMEAVIDLRVTLPKEITIDKLADIHHYIKDRFPTVESFHRKMGEIAFQRSKRPQRLFAHGTGGIS